MAAAFLGLGGNIGDPAASMRFALRRLGATAGTRVATVSRLYRTPPWGKTDQPPFLNAAARVETDLQPEALLDACLGIERDLKRERGERWGPRTIDLDVLDHDNRAFRSPKLTLPHPRMATRAFVLVPLADVAADLSIDGRTVADRLADLDRTGIDPVGEADWWKL